MLKIRFVALALAGACFIVGPISADTFTEDFSSHPAARGWRVAGDASLFQWNSTNGHLEVTWDSSRTNSYFHRPLGTVLTRSDDFTLAFDLRLRDLAIGTTPGKPYAMQLAVGFLNTAAATNDGYLRATGYDSPHVAEFNYFPDSGFGASVSPTFISSNNQFASAFYSSFTLTTNDLFRVTMIYTASNQTLVTLMTSNGLPFGPIEDVVIGTYPFSDFRVDALSISSYTDAGQDPFYAGSILAHGVVDNLSVTTPPPPVENLAGGFSNQLWQMQFTSRTNWSYTLERSGDFVSWTTVSARVDGQVGTMTLSASNAPAGPANFYRVNARRQ
jgi:hypothetical protein